MFSILDQEPNEYDEEVSDFHLRPYGYNWHSHEHLFVEEKKNVYENFIPTFENETPTSKLEHYCVHHCHPAAHTLLSSY